MLNNQLGFSYGHTTKGVYVDSFDEKDVKDDMNDNYLPKCREIDRRAYRFVPLPWRVVKEEWHPASHPSKDPHVALIRTWGNESSAKHHPASVIHDKAVTKTSRLSSVTPQHMWQSRVKCRVLVRVVFR